MSQVISGLIQQAQPESIPRSSYQQQHQEAAPAVTPAAVAPAPSASPTLAARLQLQILCFATQLPAQTLVLRRPMPLDLAALREWHTVATHGAASPPLFLHLGETQCLCLVYALSNDQVFLVAPAFFVLAILCMSAVTRGEAHRAPAEA